MRVSPFCGEPTQMLPSFVVAMADTLTLANGPSYPMMPLELVPYHVTPALSWQMAVMSPSMSASNL